MSNGKKLIIVNSRFLSQKITGVQRYGIEIARALRALDENIIFVSPRNVLDETLAEELGVKRIGVNSGHLWEQLDLPIYLARIGSPFLLSLGSTCPIFYKNQFVTHHDITYVRHPESFSPYFTFAYKYLVPRMLKSAIKILTVSEFSKNEIVDYYNISNEKVFVVPNAAGSEFFFKNNLAVTSPKYLLAVSSLCKHKNFEILARVVEKLSIPMKVVGEYGGNFAKPNLGNVGTNIEYLGRVSDKELVDLYRAALAFVFPSVYEGFGIPPIEAQACGCPVLSSNVASLPEVLGNSAHYFDPYSEVEIQKSIELMLSDKKYRARLIRLGFTNSSKYSWVRSAIKIRENIEKI